MKLSLNRLGTYRKLGLKNLIAVAYYRWQLRSGYFVKTMPVASWKKAAAGELLPLANNYSVAGEPFSVRFFSDRLFDQTSPPDWFINHYNNSRLDGHQSHWSTMPDFNLQTGDIKALWELSRFDWLIKACWQMRDSGVSPVPVNKWLDDWCELNSVNQGVNWKCAQEVSLRAMNLVMAQLILEPTQRKFNSRFREFVVAHIQRILPTVSYAKAQDNNHGTSEAVALFVLGTILLADDHDETKRLATRASEKGRVLLEERINTLVGDDGVFSQYSVNYHRMMLDTLSFGELVRRHFGAREFSSQLIVKAKKATGWLLSVTDPISGDAPNMGTNDGSLLFNCKDADFRDFRPSCDLASRLFLNYSEFPENTHGLSDIFLPAMQANDIDGKPEGLTKHSDCSAVRTSLSHGFKRIGGKSTYAILKTPHDRFRPSQADSLHLDVWHNGTNVVRDSGTYSYNPPASFSSDLGDTRFHSTVEIDGRSQMRKLSRFLYMDWLSPEKTAVSAGSRQDSANTVHGVYTDYEGATHCRQVSFDGEVFLITDTISGDTQGGILRFRLAPLVWIHDELSVKSGDIELSVFGSGIRSASLNKSVESRYYLNLGEIPVFEIVLSGDSVITTTLRCPEPSS